MICTSIEQSKHLLELGLDPKTADMVWMSDKWLYSIKDNILDKEDFREIDTLAWSLSALLEVIPRDSALYKIENTYSMHHGWTTENHTNPIDAAYEMVCWLLGQELIKKGDNDE